MAVVADYQEIVCQTMDSSNWRNVGQPKSVKNLTDNDSTWW
jgi:hypothetical protein